MSSSDSNDRLSKKDRQSLIVEEIRRSAAIRISELAQRIGVAGETIRRDLAELDEAGLVNRTYGGATLRPFAVEPAVSERGVQRVEERSRIGRMAASLIKDGQTVLIDIGSTTLHAARAFAQLRRNLTVITNALPIATAAGANPTFRVLLCPGRFDPREGGVHGEETVEFIRRYNAHWVLTGATGVLGDGAYEAHAGTAAVKRAMLQRAAGAMLLVDTGKFGVLAAERFCELTMLTHVVTDDTPPAEFRRWFAQAGISIEVAN